MAQDIETAIRTKSELHNVNSNIVRIIAHRAEVSKQRQEERQTRRYHRELAADANREQQAQQAKQQRVGRPSAPSAIDDE